MTTIKSKSVAHTRTTISIQMNVGLEGEPNKKRAPNVSSGNIKRLVYFASSFQSKSVLMSSFWPAYGSDDYALHTFFQIS